MGWSVGKDWTWSFNRSSNMFGDGTNFKEMLVYKNTSTNTEYILNCFLQMGCGASGQSFKNSSSSSESVSATGDTFKVGAIYLNNNRTENVLESAVAITNQVKSDYSGTQKTIFKFKTKIAVNPGQTIKFIFDFDKIDSSPMVIARNRKKPSTYGGEVDEQGTPTNIVKIYTSSGWKNTIPYVFINDDNEGYWQEVQPHIYDGNEWKTTTL